MKDYDEVVSCQFLAKVIVRNDKWYEDKSRKMLTLTYKALFNSFEEAKQDAIKKAESVVKEEGCRIFAEVELLIQYKDNIEPAVRPIAIYEL